MFPSDSESFSVVLSGSLWFRVVLGGSKWFFVDLSGSRWLSEATYILCPGPHNISSGQIVPSLGLHVCFVRATHSSPTNTDRFGHYMT